MVRARIEKEQEAQQQKKILHTQKVTAEIFNNATYKQLVSAYAAESGAGAKPAAANFGEFDINGIYQNFPGAQQAKKKKKEDDALDPSDLVDGEAPAKKKKKRRKNKKKKTDAKNDDEEREDELDQMPDSDGAQSLNKSECSEEDELANMESEEFEGYLN